MLQQPVNNNKQLHVLLNLPYCPPYCVLESEFVAMAIYLLRVIFAHDTSQSNLHRPLACLDTDWKIIHLHLWKRLWKTCFRRLRPLSRIHEYNSISKWLWLSSALEELQDIVTYTTVYPQPNPNNNAVEKTRQILQFSSYSLCKCLETVLASPLIDVTSGN